MNKEKLEFIKLFSRHYMPVIEENGTLCETVDSCSTCIVRSQCDETHDKHKLDVIDINATEYAFLLEHYPEFCV